MAHPLRDDTPDFATEPGEAGDAVIPFFQPFYNLQSDQLQGYEALARMPGTDGRPVLPAAFFAGAEDAGTMRDIDVRILDEALGHISRWRRAETAHGLILSVNLSRQAVGHPMIFTDVINALHRHGVPGDRLLIDITTDTFRRSVDDAEEALEWMRRLQHKEVTFCLDGFTAADLDLLPAATRVPIDIIKLHPAQVLGTAGSVEPLADVVRAIQEVDIPVVAAGVETREHLELVRSLGFEWAQGFLLGEPVSAEQALVHPATLSAL